MGKALRRKILTFSIFAIVLLILPGNVLCANFSLNPVRVYFDSSNKTNMVTVTNNSDEDITVQLRAYSWEQNAKSENMYSPTKDIVFFPKIAHIKKAEKKIVRLGTRVPQGDQEKTYRLYIEEIPNSQKTENTAVQIVMKVGVPVFIAPLNSEPKGMLEEVKVEKSIFYARLNNQGNIHFIIRSVNVTGVNSSGDEVYRTELGGRYLHSGNTKDFTLEIPDASCHKITALDVEVNTDKLSLRKKLNVNREMCQP